MQELRAPVGTYGARSALAAVAVALFGLLSMHGWGSHTSVHFTGATLPSADVMGAATGPVSHGHSGPAAGDPASAQVVAGHPSGMDSEGPSGESGAGLLGLCLAVLTGLLLTIAVLFARRGVRLPRTLLPAWQPLLILRRDRDPPNLLMLCVIRC